MVRIVIGGKAEGKHSGREELETFIEKKKKKKNLFRGCRVTCKRSYQGLRGAGLVQLVERVTPDPGALSLRSKLGIEITLKKHTRQTNKKGVPDWLSW